MTDPGSAPPAPVDPDEPPTAAQVRRAVARASRAQSLDLQETHALLHARGEDLAALMAAAAVVRDAGLVAAGRPGVVTYSPKVFIPLTRLCRDRCHYCTFATVPHRLPAAYLSPDEVLDIARRGAALGCKEALFTLGDRPEDRWPAAAEWLEAAGYGDTLSYVRAMAVKVLEETGLLPHLNPGVLSWEELARLKPVAPSMGLMLETTSTRIWSEPSGAHYGSPDKEPAVRVRTIEDAGRQAIPFTTGLLVGIGETPMDRAQSLFELRRLARTYGHIQEVIIQNFRAKPDTAMRSVDDLDHQTYLATVATARVILGSRMRIQAPPNLSSGRECEALLAAGVDDWGGVSPLTPDHVNPERPWPELDRLTELTAAAGFTLRERLTAHPEYVTREDPWLDARIRPHVRALAGPDGLAVPGRVPSGLPWQEADLSYDDFAMANAGGRVSLHEDLATGDRSEDRRSDFAEVYGDWSELALTADRAVAGPGHAGSRTGDWLESDLRAGLDLAESDPRALADESNAAAALALMCAEGEALVALVRLADEVRRDTVGDTVTYVVNRNINFTNVCYTGCRFCAFAQRRTDADAYTLTLDEFGDRVEEAWALGASEVCVQGGIHPDLPGTAYFDLARAVKARQPQMHLHAFSPMEVVNGASRSGLSIREWLTEARAAGLDTMPGTAAEILDDEVRWVLTKGKLPTASWIEVITTAHDLGIRSSSTMMYGHVDTPRHWVDHLRLLRRLQERTGGFTEFVALPFIHHNAPVYLAGLARPGPTRRDNLAVHAMARLMLHGAIDHIQTSWVKLGNTGVTMLLGAGVDDLGGTLMEETISRMAGADNGIRRSVAELQQMAAAAGRPSRQRTTTYEQVPAERVVASAPAISVVGNTPVSLDAGATTHM